MPRTGRLHIDGGYYHVIGRGLERRRVFNQVADKKDFLDRLGAGRDRTGAQCLAWAVMTKHIHLAIQVAEEPLPRIMQNLSFRYTRWINKKQTRTGHLFQGRYKAILVDADNYLLQLVRYIHLNPVRAGMVKNPEDHAWSGHRAYLGIETLPWLYSDWVLSQFAKRVKKCRQRYEAFVRAGKEEGYRQDFHHGGEDGRVLADDRFLEQVLGESVQSLPQASLDEIVDYVSAEYRVTEEELLGLYPGFPTEE